MPVTLRQLADRLSRPAGRVDPLPRAARAPAVVTAVGGVREGFQQQRGPDGRPWAPLKFARPRGGSLVLLDTGRLRASVVGRADAETVTVGTNRPGAATQHYGATIRPKRAKALAIPLTPTAARFPPRDFPGKLVWIPTRRADPSARGVLAELKWTGRGRKAKPELVRHYVLRAQVVIPARPFVGFSAETVREITRLAADAQLEVLTRRLTGG